MAEIGAFTVEALDGQARAATLVTAHGAIETPAFMPVGTQGSVKSLAPDDLRLLGAQVILCNTYHLYLRPGDELIARLGGLHRFCGWDGPILTDSGGFQVFSLKGLRTVGEDGVEFQSHIDGSRHFLSPEKAVAIQRNLGSDIVMVLDECLGYGADRAATEQSLGLTTRWAVRCREALPRDSGQLLFGIVQGGFFQDLREQSLAELAAVSFEGYALGGLSVGEPRAEMDEILARTAPLMPRDRPRYLMGVGTPRDLLQGVAAGIDLFDCVLPTRNARNGTLYTSQGRINIKRAEYREDDGPLDPACPCPTCRGFSRAYLRHLYVSRELLSYRLNTLHNLAFFLSLMRRARAAVAEGRLAELRRECAAAFEREDPEDTK